MADFREFAVGLLDLGAYWVDCVCSVVKGSERRPHAVTVYFHAVLQESGPHLLDPQEGMTAAFLGAFIRSMKARGYTFVTPDRMVDPGRPGQRLAVLTSDDGYRSVEALAPLLRREAAPLTVFLITETSRRDGICWWDQLHLAGLSSSKTRSLFKHGVTSTEARDDALAALGLHPSASAYCDSHRLLSPADVGRLVRDPVFLFGNHTRNHLSLPRLDVSRARDEVEGARQEIETWVGDEVRHFAFPYGDYGASTLELLESCGYHTAFTTEPGHFVLPSGKEVHGTHVIPRYRLRADRSATWQARIMGKGITAGPRLQARVTRWIKGLS